MKARSLVFFAVVALTYLSCSKHEGSSPAIQTAVQPESSSGPGITPPVLVSKVDPEYPPDPTHQREGVVVVEAIVTETGAVRHVAVVRSLSPAQDRVVVEAVRQWRYRPALKAGEPIRVRLPVSVSFSRFSDGSNAVH